MRIFGIWIVFLGAMAAGCSGSGSSSKTNNSNYNNNTNNNTNNVSGVWIPEQGVSWQWQLSGYPVDTGVDAAVYDVDLFEVSDTQLADLHAAGRKVICYFSAGSREDWRADAGDFDSADVGRQLDGWPGENWLDIRSLRVRAIMETRLDYAASRGCDAVEPDNVDAYANNSGFPLTEGDQLDYNRFLSSAAHARGLSVGLKNAVDLIDALQPDFDWALNEECVAYAECAAYAPFLAAGKAVFHVEYVNSAAEGPGLQASVCADPSRQGFSTLIKTWDLDAWRLACP